MGDRTELDFRQALAELVPAGATVLAAVSGGGDSVALLHLLARAGRRRLVVAHLDHGLRRGSPADRRFVEALARSLGLDCVAARRNVAAERRKDESPEEAARRVRRAFLVEAASRVGAAHIATGHTLDDQAETVLLRLLRGSGPAGLGGIPERAEDGRIVRPLLRVARAEIERFALSRGLLWREDASNRDPAYARARLRRDWLRGLGTDFNPRWLRAVGDLAEAQRRESEWIEQLVTEEAGARLTRSGAAWRLSCEGFADLPEALARRLLRRWLHEAGAGRDVSRQHLERMRSFVASAPTGKRLELPGGLVLERERGCVWLRPRAPGRPQHGC